MKFLISAAAMLLPTMSFSIERLPFQIPTSFAGVTSSLEEKYDIDRFACEILVKAPCSAAQLEAYRKTKNIPPATPPLESEISETRIVIQERGHGHVESFAKILFRDVRNHPLRQPELKQIKGEFLTYIGKMKVSPRTAEQHEKFKKKIALDIEGLEQANFAAVLADIGQMAHEFGQVEINRAMSTLLFRVSPEISDFMIKVEGFEKPNETSLESMVIRHAAFEESFASMARGTGFVGSHSDGYKIGFSTSPSASSSRWTSEDRAYAAVDGAIKTSFEYGKIGFIAGGGVGTLIPGLGTAAGAGAGATFGAVTGAITGAIRGYNRPQDMEGVTASGVEVKTETTVKTLIKETKDEKTGAQKFIETQESTTTTTTKDLKTGQESVQKTVQIIETERDSCDGSPCPETADKSAGKGCESPYDDYDGSDEIMTDEQKEKARAAAFARAQIKKDSLILLLEPKNADMPASKAVSLILMEERNANINWGVEGAPVRLEATGIKVEPFDPVFDPKPFE